MANYEDDKLQVGGQLRVHVQISDATGHLIRTSFFALMSLGAKVTAVSPEGVTSADLMATISPATRYVTERTLFLNQGSMSIAHAFSSIVTQKKWAKLSFISIQISIHFNNQFFLIYSAGEIAHSYQILPNIIEIS